MKKLLLIIACAVACGAHAQDQLGDLVNKFDSLTVEGVTYRAGEKLAIPGANDSAPIRWIEERDLDGAALKFAYLKGGYRHSLDQSTREYVSQLNAEYDQPTDTIITRSGYRLWAGARIKLGVGSTPDGTFKFVRITATSLFRYSSTNGDKRGASSANGADASYAGLDFKVIRIERRRIKNHGGADYAIINSANTSLVRLEIDVERAIMSGELDVPEQYRPHQPSAAPAISAADELLKYKKLLDSGAITQDEYNEQKKKLLAK